jgi:hypothetical protein
VLFRVSYIDPPLEPGKAIKNKSFLRVTSTVDEWNEEQKTADTDSVISFVNPGGVDVTPYLKDSNENKEYIISKV